MTEFAGHFGSAGGSGAGPAPHPGWGVVAVAVATTLLVAAPVAADGAPSLERLMAGFAAMPGLSASFREEKQMALLREPLVSRGTLYFAPPDRLARWVEEPVASWLVVDARGLTFSVDGETGHIPVDSHPMMGLLVDSLRMIFGGDLQGLRALYEIEYQAVGAPGEAGWRARLVPLREPLSGAIAELRLRGTGVSVAELGVFERNGDTTRLFFSDVDTAHHFDEEELALRFELPGS